MYIIIILGYIRHCLLDIMPHSQSVNNDLSSHLTFIACDSNGSDRSSNQHSKAVAVHGPLKGKETLPQFPAML